MLPRTTPALRTAAKRLLELETATRSASNLSATARLNERFRQILSTLLGVAGFHALLGRVVTLAKAEASELSAVQIHADGSLEGIIVHDKRRFSDGEVVLVAHLLGLLVTFVGEGLMLRLVHDVWPKAVLDDLDFDKGNP